MFDKISGSSEEAVISELITFNCKTNHKMIVFRQESAHFLCLTPTDRDQPKWRGGLEPHKEKPCDLAALEKLNKHKAGWGRVSKRNWNIM